ncbi:hypothetical protein QU481_06470 [Crenobacter sp. SG2303]|uniref:DUF4148 domain-containing protein n=1 Tax=Crenobacter oryzisoli TaxID=3056844 RepID=A0ABT7XLB5_9NEIS|nr:hypothetical protein [Crenobacter sp. SG2303]MDN0074540.1 hypothetical protein [Crenobacter sp. SG2303]
MKTATLIAASLLTLATGLAYADHGEERIQALNGRQLQTQVQLQKTDAERQAANDYAAKAIAANPDNYRNH